MEFKYDGPASSGAFFVPTFFFSVPLSKNLGASHIHSAAAQNLTNCFLVLLQKVTDFCTKERLMRSPDIFRDLGKEPTGSQIKNSVKP